MKNMKSLSVVAALFAASVLSGCTTTTAKPFNLADHDAGKDLKVKITPKVGAVEVTHSGAAVRVERNQNQKNKINPAFAKTSRKCPPFCVRPIVTAKGVETVAELEVISYMKQRAMGDDSILIVDARKPSWYKKGTLPDSVNVPFDKINKKKGADEVSIGEALETFGATEGDKGWSFDNAKTLVVFCNGPWCGQSPLAIAGLIGEGYPAAKLKWYRGGMQDWEILGLTTVKP
ncbi:MAG: rhodanese-like domain-containing protein [Pseudomonadota bacterium]